MILIAKETTATGEESNVDIKYEPENRSMIQID